MAARLVFSGSSMQPDHIFFQSEIMYGDLGDLEHVSVTDMPSLHEEGTLEQVKRDGDVSRQQREEFVPASHFTDIWQRAFGHIGKDARKHTNQAGLPVVLGVVWDPFSTSLADAFLAMKRREQTPVGDHARFDLRLLVVTVDDLAYKQLLMHMEENASQGWFKKEITINGPCLLLHICVTCLACAVSATFLGVFAPLQWCWWGGSSISGNRDCSKCSCCRSTWEWW
jgi:hypothetical protein